VASPVASQSFYRPEFLFNRVSALPAGDGKIREMAVNKKPPRYFGAVLMIEQGC